MASNTTNNIRLANVCRWLVGALFLLSGGLKAADAGYFTNIIDSYGLECVDFVAPFIILFEILLGLALTFRVKARYMAMAGIALTVVFTVVYVYGLVFHNVQDCGCFGRVHILSQSPVVVIGKNVVIVALLSYVMIKGDNVYRHRHWVALSVLLLMVIAAFFTGNTYPRGRLSYKGKVRNIPLAESKLSDFVTLSSDSSYYVFVFSYTCPHCMNSIANLKEYALSNDVDRVIGIALGDDATGEAFDSIFAPNFTVHNHATELFQLTNEFPKGYYIKDGAIRMEMEGELPCRFIFEQEVADKVL